MLPGTLNKIASIETRFVDVLGTNKQFLNRLSINYDSRDDLTVPSRGMLLVAYAGLASRDGLFNDSMYSEVGGDGRGFWLIAPDTILAGHMALRYLPTSHEVPFWALSGIGGGESVIGGEQPLRGWGAGRFYDRDSFASSVELRRKVHTFDTTSTSIDLEITPFIDVGRVFARSQLAALRSTPQSRWGGVSRHRAAVRRRIRRYRLRQRGRGRVHRTQLPVLAPREQAQSVQNLRMRSLGLRR